MRFSRKTDYGMILMGALRLSFRDGAFITLTRIARERRLPLAFLEKLAERLRKAGYLEAKRGAEGGYRLIRDPAATTLQELVEVFEESAVMRCMESARPDKQCPLVRICPTRKTWASVQEKIDAVLRGVTLAEM